MTEGLRAWDAVRWDEFIEWARRFYAWEKFPEEELNYKLAAGEVFERVREGFLTGNPDWRQNLWNAFGSNNLTDWRVNNPFLRRLNDDDGPIADALLAVWDTGNRTPQERVRQFVDAMGAAHPELRGLDSLCSVLLMARGARLHPPYRSEPFRKAYKLTGYLGISTRAPAAAKFEHALGFLDVFIEEAMIRRLDIPDRLTAQGLVWTLTSAREPETWSLDTLDDLAVYRAAFMTGQEFDEKVVVERALKRRADAPRRKAVELWAMKVATRFYEKARWSVEDVSARESFDLRCTRAGVVLHVEVKGLSTDGPEVVLTRNEVANAYEHRTALFVQSRIRVSSDDDGTPVATGGTSKAFEPWGIDKEHLTPIAYSYRLPERD